MTLTLTAAARRTIRDLLARDPSRPALRLVFAGGCGALGYRLTRAAGPMTGDEPVVIDGIAFHLDYKSRVDLDGAAIDVGDDRSEDLVILHDRAVVGGFCSSLRRVLRCQDTRR